MKVEEALIQLRDDLKEWVTNNLNAIGTSGCGDSQLVIDYSNKLVNGELYASYTATQDCYIFLNAVNTAGVTVSVNGVPVLTSTALTLGLFVQKSDVVTFSQNARITVFGVKFNTGGGSGGLTIDKIYPVGSIYMSINNVDPSTLFGGTWEQIKDKFLLSAGDTYQAGATGGEEEHTLTVDEIPAHNHSIRFSWESGTKNTLSVNNTPVVASSVSGYLHIDANNGSTFNTGGSQPHNNMPPYLTVYMWKRVA